MWGGTCKQALKLPESDEPLSEVAVTAGFVRLLAQRFFLPSSVSVQERGGGGVSGKNHAEQQETWETDHPENFSRGFLFTLAVFGGTGSGRGVYSLVMFWWQQKRHLQVTCICKFCNTVTLITF